MTLATLTEPTARPRRFDEAADDATLARTADALRGKGYEVHVVDDHKTAKALLVASCPRVPR